MSLRKLNKITGLEPEKETIEEHQGPSKTLQETIEVLVSQNHLMPLLTPAMSRLLTFQQKNVKLELSEVEHYVEKCEGSHQGVKRQLEEQLFRTKQEMVKLERLLNEELRAGAEEEDVFDAQK